MTQLKIYNKKYMLPLATKQMTGCEGGGMGRKWEGTWVHWEREVNTSGGIGVGILYV